MKNLSIALRSMLVMTVLTGLVYPAVVTGLARWLFPHQAGGSLIEGNGRVVGSHLIGQRFTRPEYFQGRPSAAGEGGYDGLASGGSNLGPTNRKLVDRVRGEVERLRRENPGWNAAVPADLPTASASGLDPHISPESAELQIGRVARARGISAGDLRRLVAAHTEPRQFGFLGEPRVNVMELNLALDHAGRR
jgi:potassium-transporting ATPase KdpC subunit